VHLLSSRASGRLIAFQNAEEQTLQAEVVRLGSVTAEANRAVAQANERANQMELQTEELRKENLEIQRKINPRFLTASEQKSIIDAITPFRRHQIIITKLGDGEAGPYGDSIIAAFQKAGWRVQVNYVGITSPTYGVVFRISAHPDIAIKAAFADFQNVGVKTSIQEIPTQDDSWIDMLVGLKPVA